MNKNEYETIHNWLNKTRKIIRKTANEMLTQGKNQEAAQANLTAEAMTAAIQLLDVEAIANGIHPNF